MSSQSLEQFQELLLSVDQLVAIHAKLQSGRGRRHEQDAIHRAGVVMTVAAWQAYIEKVLGEALTIIGDAFGDGAGEVPAPTWAKHSFLLRQADVKSNLKRFNTPSDRNVRDLLRDALEFDPWPSWVWQYRRRQWNVSEVRRRTNSWVDIRHTIAHGVPLPNDIEWIQDNNGRPRLTLNLLKECRKHFFFLARRTDMALSTHLTNHFHTQAPW